MASVGRVAAQPTRHTFTWQLQPYCNRVVVTIGAAGDVHTLDGYDDQCGGGQRAPVVGAATPNPDGSIGLGVNIVTVPGGAAVHVVARIDPLTLSGTWADDHGLSGRFVLDGSACGVPRPVPGSAGDITAVEAGRGLTGGGLTGDVALAVDPTVVQTRVTGTCPGGQAVRGVDQDGSVSCEPVAGGAGDITDVLVGPGLVGGGTSGPATVAENLAADGAATTVARGDHEHRRGARSVGVGPGSLPSPAGGGNTAVGDAALPLTTGNDNTALGWQAGSRNVNGSENTFLGARSRAATGGLVNATALGANAEVAQSHAVVLGSIQGVNNANTSANVGIGTTGPRSPLEGVTTSSGPNLQLTGVATGVPTVAPGLVFRSTRGTPTNPAALSSGDLVGGLTWFGGYDGTSGAQVARLRVSAAEDFTPTGFASRLDLEVASVGDGTRRKLAIDEQGDVGIGPAADALDKLHVQGDLRVGAAGTVGCVKRADGTGIVGTCSSDLRFKRDVTPFSATLERLARLKPVHYFWRAAEFPNQAFGTAQAYGLIAQDVQQVMPELVSTAADGYLAVDYSKLPLLAVQAIGELKHENDALRASLRQLLDRLSAVEQAVASPSAALAPKN